MAEQQSHHDLAAQALTQANPQTAEQRLAAAHVHALLHLADAILVAGAPMVVDDPAAPKAKAGLGGNGGYR